MALASRKGQPVASKTSQRPKAAPEEKAVSEAPVAVVEATPEPVLLVEATIQRQAVAPITLDAWAEQTRRDLNTFVGCQRIARIQGGDTVRTAQPGEWLERFEAWRITANG